MISDTLYDLAHEFRRRKLLQKLDDSQVFAVKHSDGSTGWCVVMGWSGGINTLAVYSQERGLRSIFKMTMAGEKMHILDVNTIARSQDYVSVTFANRDELPPWSEEEVNGWLRRRGLRLRGRKQFPVFECCRPQALPWKLEDEADLRHMEEALRAALAVAERLEYESAEEAGFVRVTEPGMEVPLLVPSGDGFEWQRIVMELPREEDFPHGRIHDELAVARLKKYRGPRTNWNVHLFLMPAPIHGGDPGVRFEEIKEPPVFPWAMMVFDRDSDLVLGVILTPYGESYESFFSEELLRIMQDNGLPASLQSDDPRTLAFLKDIARQLNVPLEDREKPGNFLDAMDSLAEHLRRTGRGDDGEDWDDEDDEDDEDDWDGEEEDLSSIDVDRLLEMSEVFLLEPKLRAEIPDDVLLSFKELDAEGLLTPRASRALKNELKRRSL